MVQFNQTGKLFELGLHDLNFLVGEIWSKFAPLIQKDWQIHGWSTVFCSAINFLNLFFKHFLHRFVHWGPDLYLKWMEDSGLSYALSWWRVTSWYLLILPGLHQFPDLNINKWHMFKLQGHHLRVEKTTTVWMFFSRSWECATSCEFYKGGVRLSKCNLWPYDGHVDNKSINIKHSKKKKSTCCF